MIVAAEAAKHLSLWQDYLHTTFDLAHVGAELTFTLVFDLLVGALLWPLVKRAVRLHDRKEHVPALLPYDYPEQRPELWA